MLHVNSNYTLTFIKIYDYFKCPKLQISINSILLLRPLKFNDGCCKYGNFSGNRAASYYHIYLQISFVFHKIKN